MASITRYPGSSFTSNWSNIAAISADDGNTATAYFPVFGGAQAGIDAWNFNFSAIPDGSTITGVQVTVSGTSLYGCACIHSTTKLRNDSGVTFGTGPGAGLFCLVASDIDQTFPVSTTSLWGATLTTSIVKSTNFGVQVLWVNPCVDDEYPNLDAISMTVHYTPPPNNNLFFGSNF